MNFSFWNDDSSKLNKINLKTNASWSNVQKNINNEQFNSIWKMIDNGDGIVQKEEIELLNKLLNIADNSVEKTKGNKIIENEELAVLAKKIQDGSIKKELDTRTFGTFNTENTKLKNFSYIDNVSETQQNSNRSIDRIRAQRNSNATPSVINVDYSSLNKLGAGEFFIEKYTRVKNDDGTYTETPVAYKKQDSGQGRNYGWSEGLDRQISKISLSSLRTDNSQGKQFPVIINELKEIGKEVGFDVEEIHMEAGIWVEDYAVRRADGKVLVMSEDAALNIMAARRYSSDIISSRKNISATKQGMAADYFDLIEQTVQDKDKVYSKSYLEGGNVLNTCLADGTPAAVVGSESIGYTLEAMGLENNEENIEVAKNQIAEDLGIKKENVTFMPQYDFHIDMCYRPLHNGEMAVPDYEEGIKILKETQIANMDDKSKQALIEKLEEMNAKTASIRQEAVNTLEEKGYKIVKIPCFAEKSDAEINFMNGVGGTSKTGETFYITNKSEYPELNDAVQKYFKQAGVDKMYFVSTNPFLKSFGGIDCLTQEV